MLESLCGDSFQHGAVLHELALHRYGVSDWKMMTMGVQLQIHPLLRQRLDCSMLIRLKSLGNRPDSSQLKHFRELT